MMYGWGYGGAAGWGGMILGPILMILFIAAAVYVAALVLRAAGLGWQPSPLASSALDILKERLARGEIDKAEFEEKRKIIAGA